MRLILRVLCVILFSGSIVDGPAWGARQAPSLPLQYIDVIGQVLDRDGKPVPGTDVSLDGHAEVSTTVEDDGSYTLTVPVEHLGDPARRAVTARIVARRPGWNFTLRNGQTALALEIRLQSKTDPPRCRVRSNLLRSVDAVISAIQRGDRTSVLLGGDFVGEQGTQESRNPSLRSEAVTIVGTPTEPPIEALVAPELRRQPAADPGTVAPKKTPPVPVARRTTPVRATTGDPGPATSREPASSASEPTAPAADARARPTSRTRIRRVDPPDVPRIARGSERAAAPDTTEPGIVKMPGPGITQTDASLIRRVDPEASHHEASSSGRLPSDVLAVRSGCNCRIRGTIEIHPDHLLARPLTVIIRLRDTPAVGDTIQLFMGSPRAFELPLLKCGTYTIEVDAVARREFNIASADGRGPVDCRRGGLRQLRLVMSPR